MKTKIAILGALAAGAAAVAAVRGVRRLHENRTQARTPAAATKRTPAQAAPHFIIATRLYAPEAAAAALRLRVLAQVLARQGGQVTVLTSTPAHLQAPADAGITVRSWPALRDENSYIRGYFQYLSFDLPLAFRLLCQPRPDLIVVEPPPTTGAVVRAVAKMRRIPYVYYAADIWSDAAGAANLPPWVVSALRAVEQWALTGAQQVFAVSDVLAQRARELGARRVLVVTNGIDTDTFTTLGAGAPQAPSEPYFLYAGTASQWQGAGIFIEALRIVQRTQPQVQLVFLGQGADWPVLTQLAQADPRVVLHPLVPPAQAAAWQRGAVASVVSIRPGLGYDFAYPTKIFAALACGTPVIYAGPGPARAQLAESQLGWAVDYAAADIAQAMLQALAAAADANADKAAARARRRQWVLEHHSLQAALEKATQQFFLPASSPEV